MYFVSLSKLNKLPLKTPHDYLILMKLTIPTIGVLSAIVLLTSVGAIYAVSFESNLSSNESSIPGTAYMVGNVKVTHFNEIGDVIGYRQGTNHITATGMSIIMGQVFSQVNASYPDVVNVTGRVSYMEIGTEGDPITYQNRLRWNNTDIIAPVGAPCLRVASTIDNITQGAAHKAGSSCDPATACNARMNVTAVAQFQGAVCTAVGIDEAGIFTAVDGASGGLLFARNTFGSVNLGLLDTLQLEWEFTFTDS